MGASDATVWTEQQIGFMEIAAAQSKWQNDADGQSQIHALQDYLRKLIDSHEALRTQLSERTREPRCIVTGNLFGTDTWMVGSSCPCATCQRMLKEAAQARADALQERVKELEQELEHRKVVLQEVADALRPTAPGEERRG